MRVQLSEIPEHGLVLHDTLSLNWLSEAMQVEEQDPAKPDSDMSVDLKIRKENKRVSVKGNISFGCEFLCSRCGADGHIDLKLDIKEIFLPIEKFAARDSKGIDLDARDFKHVFYEDDEINLGEYLAETARLAMPVFPRCRDEESCSKNALSYSEDWDVEVSKDVLKGPVNPKWRSQLSQVKTAFDKTAFDKKPD